MALTHDWEVRIDNWLKALEGRLTRTIAELPVRFAATKEQLSPAAARGTLAFKPIRPGTSWGREWEYGWFRCAVKLPAAPPGKAVVLTGNVGDEGNESIVFVNGRAVGGMDRWHRHIDLTRASRGSGRMEILLESYAGHRRPGVYIPFVLPGEPLLPPPRPRRQSFGALRLAEWNEPAYQLWIDATVLRRLIRCAPADSLRQHRLAEALKELSCLLDLEADEKDFEAGVPWARRFLADLLEARNGSTAPQMYCFGHAHIDVAWLWPLAQTYRKSAHTFSSMLTLMERYQDFRFLQSQAQLYEFLAEQYPEIYRRIKAAARRGQWIADGAMWVEADMNVSGGEALIRQFLLGKRFFKREFGTDCQLCWLPDVFGYNANLPQILRGCGVKYFSTQKIYWNYHGGTTFPYETFTWEGIDGSTVLAHMHRNYNAETHPEAIAGRWKLCVHKDQTDSFLFPFGWGDGGGGPTRDHLEYLRREADLEGLPRTRSAGPQEFFAELERSGPPADRWCGEMYLEVHRGTYTSQARTKRGNRKGELALREAELWSALATAARGRKYPAQPLEAAWKKLLLNQFHDVLPGSSITRVYQEAEKLYQEVLADCDRMASSARASLSTGRAGWTVWNSLSWPRYAFVSLPARGGRQRVVDAAGNVLPSQPVGAGPTRRLLVQVPDVPPVGGMSIELRPGRPADAPSPVTARASTVSVVMENEFLRLRINRRGEIDRLYDKQARRQLVPARQAMNRLEVYRDNPAAWDAWDIDVSYKCAPVRLGAAESVELRRAGPLEARALVRRRIGRSSLRQEIVLRRGCRRIDFETRIDWQETHRLLKVAFPAEMSAAVLRGEIQFGHVIRPTHRNTEFERQRFEWPAQKWADLSEAGYGIAVLNDCKYGYDFLDGVLRLTLLRAPVAPDPQADRGRHELTYALLAHEGGFAAGQTVRQAYELNAPPILQPGRCAGGQVSLLQVDHPGIVAETLKRSQDGRGTVVRLYESLGATARARLRLGLPARDARECDMLESPQPRLRLGKDGSVPLTFRPFEVKTILFC